MTPIILLIYIHVLLLLFSTINAPLAYLLVCYVSSMRLALCLWRASPRLDAPRELHYLIAAAFFSYFVVASFLKSFHVFDVAPGISADSCHLMAMLCESFMLIMVHLTICIQCIRPTTAVFIFCLPPSGSPEECNRAWSMVSTWEHLVMLPHCLVTLSHAFLVVFYFVNPPFSYFLVRFLFVTWTAISTFSREDLNGPHELHHLECLLYMLKLVPLGVPTIHAEACGVDLPFQASAAYRFFGFNEYSGMLAVKALESTVLTVDLLGSLVRGMATK